MLDDNVEKLLRTTVQAHERVRPPLELRANSSESTTFEADDDRNKNRKPVNQPTSGKTADTSTTSTAGPGAVPSKPSSPAPPKPTGQLKFQFAPTMGPLLTPRDEDLPVGSDAWAFAKGYISVAPIRAEFGGLQAGGCGFGSDEGKEQVFGSFWDEPSARM
jgi:tubulin--tyrosine ligase